MGPSMLAINRHDKGPKGPIMRVDRKGIRPRRGLIILLFISMIRALRALTMLIIKRDVRARSALILLLIKGIVRALRALTMLLINTPKGPLKGAMQVLGQW